MMKNKCLGRLATEELARRHQMNRDASALAAGDRCRVDWVRGSGIQPLNHRRRVMGRVKDVSALAVVVCAGGSLGALAAVMV